MKKRYVLGIIGLLLCTGLTPNITADIFPRVDDNTVNVQLRIRRLIHRKMH